MTIRGLAEWYRGLGLRAKFALHIAGSILLLFGLIVPAVVYLQTEAALEQARHRGLELTKVFAHASVHSLVADDFLAMRHIVNSIASDPGVLYVMIHDRQGRLLVHSDIRRVGESLSDPVSAAAARADKPVIQDLPDAGAHAEDFTVPIYVMNETPAVARIGISFAEEMAKIRETRHVILGVAILALAAGVGLAGLQARSVTRPVGQLVEGADALSRGRLDHRIPESMGGELAQLAGAFNRMAGSVQALIERLKQSHDALSAAQDELVRQTRMAAIGQIAAAVAHEIRNPLSALSTCVQLLRRDLPADSEDVELIQIIQTEARRLNEIVSDFLTFGRPRPPRWEAVVLADVIQEAVTLLQRDPRCSPALAFDLSLDPTLPAVPADRDQLHQVLWNLCLNAVQAMGPEGKLRVDTRWADGRAVIRIEDTGPGIPGASTSRIFDPFYTTKAGGIGLGLAIVRRIVEDHGGDIAVESSQEKGTCFTLTLALEQKQTSPGAS
jgi:signal transduction histidine kinase